MSEQKIIFFDIDGTLEDQYGHIPKSASSCIRKLKEKGHMVCVASGRPMWQIHDQIRELGFDGYVASAGAYVEVNHVVKKDIQMNRESFVQLAGYLEKHRTVFLVETTEASYMLQSQYARSKEFAGRDPDFVEMEVPVLVKKLSEIIGVKKILAFSDDLTKEDLKMRWRGTFDITGISYTRGAKAGYEISMAGVNKAEAIGMVCRKLGVEKSRVIAVGDSDNDVEMLQMAGIGIAVGNATEAAKKAADFIAEPAAQDGVEKAFVKLGMIEL